MHIRDMQRDAWLTNEAKGFHKKDAGVPLPYVLGLKLMLSVGELAEALEEVRAGKPNLYYGPDEKPEGLAAELADTVIRIADIAEVFGIDLQDAIDEKMRYNSGRPYMHGGKKF